MTATAICSPDPGPQEDIADVVGRFVALQPSARGNLRGTCPFCQSTAFNVRPSFGTFHCFGCGQGGDVSRFKAKIERG